jgi:hypothetical protein
VEDQAGFADILPNSDFANSSTLSSVWVSQTPQIGLVYSSNGSILDVLEMPSDGLDKSTFDQVIGMVGKDGARVQTIDGTEALVVQAGSDSTGGNPALIHTVVNGLTIQISSLTLSADQLIPTAKSMIDSGSQSASAAASN